MSRSLNKACLIGNLGNDPEIRSTGSGVQVANLSVATTRRWNDRSGNAQEKTEWHRVVCWDRLADICERYLNKGDRVYVEGRIEYRQFEDRDGNTRYVTEIRALELIMLGGRGGDGARGGPPPAAGRPDSGGPSGAGGESGSDVDDDLPF